MKRCNFVFYNKFIYLMISIIICSKQPILDNRLSENIKNTIGSAYEIVHIDNSHCKYSIFEAYNIGVKRAKGQYLCFMHEDVVFHSSGWGAVVEKYLCNSSVGALGVAGGCVAPQGADWRFYDGGFEYVNLLQGALTLEEDPNYYICYLPHRKKIHGSGVSLHQVAVLDGVWICIRKELFSQIRFDDVSFHSFHLYDSDISMQVNKLGKDLFVVSDILLEHMSEGSFSKEFEEGMEVFNQKWKDDLPIVRGVTLSEGDMRKYLEGAPERLAQRMRLDYLTTVIRKLHALKKSGTLCRDFTDEELLLIKRSVFRRVKWSIKNKHIPLRRLFQIMREQFHNPLLEHKGKLIAKFFWYRMVGAAHFI